jgi:membrane associated rhomboid family serine protease
MPTNWVARFGRWTENRTVATIGGWLGRIPAFVFVGAWFLLQLREGFYSVTLDAPYLGSRVAYWAHVGGFAAGAFSMAPFLTSKHAAEVKSVEDPG